MIQAIDAVVYLWTKEVVQGFPKHMEGFLKLLSMEKKYYKEGIPTSGHCPNLK